ncbi:MAG: hypothetical protein H6713_20400 [Myxococcales bacterium]|nr:hypothetical protein [Myxococcales bacterium]
MAVTEIKAALRTAADTVAGYLKDASVLVVETQTIDAGSGDEPKLAARTVIRLDGDNTSVVPASKNEDGKWELDTVLHDIHMQNVRSAIEYRSKILESMLGLLR